MTTTSHYRRGVLQAILAGFFLSSAGIGMRLIEAATPMQVNFYRAFGLLLFSVLVLTVTTRGRPWRQIYATGLIGVVGGVPFAMASLCVIFAFANTTVANVMFIVSLAPFCTALLAWVILGEKVSVKTWIAISIAVAGVLIMVYGGLSPQGWIGVAWAFGMAVTYGLFTVITRRGRDRNMFPVVFWSGLTLTVIAGLSVDSFDVPRNDALISLALGVFQVGLGGLLLVSATRHVPAAQIVFLAMLEVVLSPIWVWLFVGEVPTTQSLVGGAVILGAITFLTLATRHDAPVVRSSGDPV